MNRFILPFCLIITLVYALPADLEVSLYVQNREAVRDAQNAGLMIDNYDSRTGELRGVIFETDLPALRSLGYPVEILPERDARVLAKQRREPSGYPTMTEYKNFMTGVVTDHPVIASLDTFGWSQGGRPLLMLKISNRVGWDETEPEFCYISTMHGDEPPGMIFLMWFIDSLTDNYGYDPRITRLVDSCEIYINPLLNPDGYDYGSHSPRRYLNNGVDMNRNFPVPDGVDGNDGTFSAYAETGATIDWYMDRFISYTINFHTGALVANYPWDHTSLRSTDDDLYQFLALNYSTRNLPMYYGSFPQGITNGYDWYEVDGSLQDWTIWTRGDLHITVELYDTKCPSFSILDDLWDDNYDAFCAAIEVTLNHGVHGIVTDSITGDSLGAIVDIDGLEQNAYSSPNNGYYHRILLSGDYDLTFTCPGYYDKTLSVTVPDSGLARMDIQLVPMNPIYIYQTDFESDDGGLTQDDLSSYEDWEYGTPGQGIIEPYSGTNVWGTILDDEYHNTSTSRLRLTDISLPDVDSLTLSYMQWFSFQDISSGEYHDGGNLKVWTSPSVSEILSPTPGYNHPMSSWNNLIPGENAFSGLNQRKWWHEVRVDLTTWAGETIDLTWDFGSSSVNVQVGWYIDNIAIYYPDTTPLYAREGNVTKPIHLDISTYPNPFNSSIVIHIDGVDIPDIERLQIDIFSIEGRCLSKNNRLEYPAKGRSLLWRPHNELPSGVYLVKASLGDLTSTERIVYLK